MSLFELLEKKQKKRSSFYKSHEYHFYLTNKHLLSKTGRFAYIFNDIDEFKIMRANIIIRGILNKKLIEEEIKNLDTYIVKGQKLDHVKLISTIKEKMVDEPYFLDGKNKIYIPFFSRAMNFIYMHEPEKLLIEPYVSLKEEFNDSVVDPFDTYGPKLFDSLFTRLLKVDSNGKEIAYFHYDTNTIYIVNDQGRLDSKIVLFDEYIKRPNYNHMLERITPVTRAYFDNDREKMITALFDNGFISTRMLLLLNKGEH